MDWGQQRPPQPRRKAPLDDPGSSPGQALGKAPQARLQHRLEQLRPMRRRTADRGQHRRAHSHPRHPRPLRKARRASESALPTRPARTARCSRVTLRRPRRRKRNQEENTKRRRTLSAVLGPLPGIGEKWRRKARRRGPAMPTSASRTSDPRPNRRFARPPPTRYAGRKGRLNCLYFRGEQSFESTVVMAMIKTMPSVHRWLEPIRSCRSDRLNAAPAQPHCD